VRISPKKEAKRVETRRRKNTSFDWYFIKIRSGQKGEKRSSLHQNKRKKRNIREKKKKKYRERKKN